ncbi:MAG TPA: iron ABC transporter permease [Bacteroidales bacterium]|nr:iron ABC transporter permease [Bacteroidales bacterium]
MSRNSLLFLMLSLILVVLFLLDLVVGSVQIPLKDFYTAFLNEGDSIYREILFGYRLPKALTAILAGAALSVAGLLMQTLFRNPLAGPDVLGVNAGASLGVALVTMFTSGVGVFILGFGSWGLVVASVVGAVVVLLLVLLASVRVPDLVSLLIVGMMFGYIASSVVSLLQNVSNPDTLKVFVIWTFGSLSAVTWKLFPVLLIVVALGLLLAVFLQKSLNAMLLGEHYAKGLGVSIPRTRFLIILSTALLAGGVTAFAGPIGFVGITVPHLARGLFKSWNHRMILPASFLCGASLMLLCDCISQSPFLSNALPINSVTALFGAPMIIWILLKKNR